MIFFLCSAPINHQLPGLSLYESFDAVSQGKAVATLTNDARSLVQNFAFPFNPIAIRRIITASSGQTYETGKLFLELQSFPHAQRSTMPELEGIRFSMQSLIDHSRFEMLGYAAAIVEARHAFIEQLFDGMLDEKLPQLEQRMQRLLETVLSLDGDVVCIGHAFFLKILEAYINNPKIIYTRNEFIAAFNPSQKPYNSLCGFAASPAQIATIV